ncbi:hypothetical protein BDP55DRAFT_632672 [Colletotrichum godetiae]|uniref:Uncharacterized protein n=1 Tax=Colletotrichum godetiae TaxID=1209918 RepID=A0AAJ0ESG0_9PEZI|nr:uncharacterized protein BDP55DRAFT_632672 [Colletotrichum godetiae]KAK1675036.1 hypothetical protein BDP55DRAFT_632672 [Colletotrichum godetiae]
MLCCAMLYAVLSSGQQAVAATVTDRAGDNDDGVRLEHPDSLSGLGRSLWAGVLTLELWRKGAGGDTLEPWALEGLGWNWKPGDRGLGPLGPEEDAAVMGVGRGRLTAVDGPGTCDAMRCDAMRGQLVEQEVDDVLLPLLRIGTDVKGPGAGGTGWASIVALVRSGPTLDSESKYYSSPKVVGWSRPGPLGRHELPLSSSAGLSAFHPLVFC